MSFRLSRRARACLGVVSIAVLLTAATPAVLSAQPAQAQAAAVPKAPVLLLADALARAAAADPTLVAATARIDAAEASVRQAGVRPNPSLDLEIENFAGTGPYGVLGEPTATLSYQQTVERGGKRSSRIDRARAEVEVARRQGEVRRLDLLKDVQGAYAEALAAEAQSLIAEARHMTALQSEAEVRRRVLSARDPLFAGSRADMISAQASIERDQARLLAAETRATLARFWGGAADFSLPLEEFFIAAAPAAMIPVAQADIAVLEAQRDLALATVRVEQARPRPDPTLRAGVRYLGQGSDVALVVGGSIPLQRSDTNQGNIDRALAERNAAEADIASARLLRERQILTLTARMRSAAAESERIRAEVIPAALRTSDQVRDGFARGGFEYANIVEAERALADARARRVQVLHQFHTDQATLDRLTGRHAGLVQSLQTVGAR